MGIFDLFNRKVFVILNINGRFSCQSKERNYDNPIDKVLEEYKLGKITGGGIYFAKNGEPMSCDIEIELKNNKKEMVISLLQNLKLFPKGSCIVCENDRLEIGDLEGAAVHLNGKVLEDGKNEYGDVNGLVREFDSALGEAYFCWSGWECAAETALYFYGKSYEEMKEIIMPVINNNPLCEKCQIERIC